MKPAVKNALTRLIAIRTLSEAEKLVDSLVTTHGLRWRPVGDRENNYGTINIGSDPGHALVERITNAIDAVIEREAIRRTKKAKKNKLPASPREAVETWLKVPGGRVHNLKIPDRQKLADEVVLRILDGSSPRHPTVEVQDAGVGLTASQIPKTILSLGESNKIDKPYLAGAYGQGGSTALAFSPQGTLIVSRRQADLLEKNERDELAVTFVRFNALDPEVNKNGRFEYLVLPDNNVPSVPALNLDEQPYGTTVVHFNMEISQYAAMLTQLTGSLWWLLQNTLFDPVLPLWAEERRVAMLKAADGGKAKEARRRTIAGNFTRLTDDKKDKIEHADGVEVIVPHKDGDVSVKVNYWVVRQSPDSPSGQPIDAYVDPYRPISFTFFGQTHGTEERRFTAERLSLPYLAKFLIIQVELDNLNPQARRELFSTTRDRLKQLPIYDLMREMIRTALSEDEDLNRLNEERKEKILSKHSDKEQKKIKERFARLMERLSAGVDATAPSRGGGEPGRNPSGPSTSPRQPLKPLPTKKKPTFIRVANTQKPVAIRLDRHALIRLESDAPDGYLTNHVHARLAVVAEPEGIIVLENRSDFRGGRARLMVRPTEKAKAGQRGKLTVFLFTPESDQLKDRTTFIVEVPEENTTAGSEKKADVKVPTPIEVYKDQWLEFGWTDHSVAIVQKDSRDTNIYVNMDNSHISKLLRSGGYQEVGIQRMKNNYLLYTAFYAWMKYVAEEKRPSGLAGREFEEYQQQEYDRVAQTVVHAIAASSRLGDE